jgi:hypothetical protein
LTCIGENPADMSIGAERALETAPADEENDDDENPEEETQTEAPEETGVRE